MNNFGPPIRARSDRYPGLINRPNGGTPIGPNHTVPYGTVPVFARIPGNKLPGYLHNVPTGQRHLTPVHEFGARSDAPRRGQLVRRSSWFTLTPAKGRPRKRGSLHGRRSAKAEGRLRGWQRLDSSSSSFHGYSLPGMIKANGRCVSLPPVAMLRRFRA